VSGRLHQLPTRRRIESPDRGGSSIYESRGFRSKVRVFRSCDARASALGIGGAFLQTVPCLVVDLRIGNAADRAMDAATALCGERCLYRPHNNSVFRFLGGNVRAPCAHVSKRTTEAAERGRTPLWVVGFARRERQRAKQTLHAVKLRGGDDFLYDVATAKSASTETSSVGGSAPRERRRHATELVSVENRLDAEGIPHASHSHAPSPPSLSRWKTV